MNLDDRQQMLSALLKGVIPGTDAYRELEEMCISELDDLEPIIDQIVERELKSCIAIIAENMTPEERIFVSRRLNERAGLIVRH
jgi:hypothetical protein